jgi:hypothetical protein
MHSLRSTHHAGGKENPRLDVVERNIARHLADCISDCEDSINLIKLVASETQLLSHSGNVGIVQVGPIKVVQKVHETTKGQDKKVELHHQLSFPRRMLLTPEVLSYAVRHDE